MKSHQTALVRACAPLLQSVCYPLTEEQQDERAIVDPYGTLVWYFNSLRELGHAATLCVGDIPEFLKGALPPQGHWTRAPALHPRGGRVDESPGRRRNP
ncbi:MAG: hypothetical protein WDN44_09145 [Sphingomonas sp.]